MIILLIILLIILCPALLASGIAIWKGKKRSRLPERSADGRAALYAEKLSAMIQCPTVSSEDPDEEEKERFRQFHQVLERLFPLVHEKLKVTDLDGSLLYFWKGQDSRRPVLLMSHQDVVPTSGTWRFPPFSGTIADGRIWGRGACDTKCSLMGFLQAAEELLEEGYVPAQDIYLAGSCTEEVGGEGAPRIVHELKRRGVKLWMVCDEGGGIQDAPIPGIKDPIAMIGIQEKGTADITFRACSVGGHAHTPPKHNPVEDLAAFVCSMKRRPPFRSRLTRPVRSMLERLAPYADFPIRVVLSNLWLFAPLVEAFTPKISPDAASMLRTTCAFTRMQGEEAFNVIPVKATLGANVRFIPHQPMPESLKILEKRARAFGVEIESVHGNDCTKAADIRSDAFGLLKDALGKTFPELGWAPYILTGATDARFFDEICDHIFRFAPVEYGPEQKRSIHGIDENLECDCLPGCVDFYRNLILIHR